jgi:hypothetical protein
VGEGKGGEEQTKVVHYYLHDTIIVDYYYHTVIREMSLSISSNADCDATTAIDGVHDFRRFAKSTKSSTLVSITSFLHLCLLMALSPFCDSQRDEKKGVSKVKS